MAELIENEDHAILGSRNELDLVLSRGQGLFDVDFEDENVKEEWRNKKICEGHRKELSTEWEQERYYHYIRKRDVKKVYWHSNKVCSFPEILEKHEKRPLLQSRLEINKEEANAILMKEGILLHIGLRKFSALLFIYHI